jgi:multimeric flavodoxin WrbA
MRQALLLLGSPKAGPSTSGSLLDYLGMRLREHGVDVLRIHLDQTMTVGRCVSDLLTAIDKADVILLAFPLYIDGLPSNALRAMEAIADHPCPSGARKRIGFAAISNSGFPEAAQSETALATCHRFAEDAEFSWRGGLALGGGGEIAGRAIETLGPRFQNVRACLDLVAQALAADRAIPTAAVRLMATSTSPPWLFRRFANARWRRLAKAHGARWRLKDRPYRQETLPEAASGTKVPAWSG